MHASFDHSFVGYTCSDNIMSKLVREHQGALKRLLKTTERTRRKMIHTCDRRLLDCLCECAKNVLNGRVPLTKRQLTRLRQYKRNLHTLATKKPSLKSKKRVLQKGGFIGALLTPILSLLGGLLGSR